MTSPTENLPSIPSIAEWYKPGSRLVGPASKTPPWLYHATSTPCTPSNAPSAPFSIPEGYREVPLMMTAAPILDAQDILKARSPRTGGPNAIAYVPPEFESSKHVNVVLGALVLKVPKAVFNGENGQPEGLHIISNSVHFVARYPSGTEEDWVGGLVRHNAGRVIRSGHWTLGRGESPNLPDLSPALDSQSFGQQNATRDGEDGRPRERKHSSDRSGQEEDERSTAEKRAIRVDM